MSEDNPLPELPPTPRLPDPPQPAHRRPRKPEDPAEKFLARRGITAGDAGNMGKAMGIGTALIGSILGGVLVGWLADTYLIHPKDTPWGLIAGFLLGCVSGFTNLIKLGNALNK